MNKQISKINIDPNIDDEDSDSLSKNIEPHPDKKISDSRLSDCCNIQWNYKIILFLKKMGAKTMAYRWMHDYEAQKYEKISDIYKILEIIILALLGMVTGGEMVGLIFGTGLNKNRIALIVITSVQMVILLIYSIVKGIHDASHFERKMQLHNHSSYKFGEINLSIQNQLSLNLSERDPDKIFLKNIIKNFNDLMFVSEKISTKAKKKYLKNIEDDDVFQPFIEDDEGRLQIVIHNKKDIEEGKNNSDNDLKKDYEINRWLRHF